MLNLNEMLNEIHIFLSWEDDMASAENQWVAMGGEQIQHEGAQQVS